MTLKSAKKEIELTAKKISKLYDCPLRVKYDYRKPPKWIKWGFFANGYCFSEGGEGIITVNLPSLEQYNVTLNREVLGFIIAHEASHILLGQNTDAFIHFQMKEERLEKKVPIQLTYKKEKDADALAAKIHRELGRPIENVLHWMKYLEKTDSIAIFNLNRFQTISKSFEEGWKSWTNWNHMGPICNNLVAERFQKGGANKFLVNQIRNGFCHN